MSAVALETPLGFEPTRAVEPWEIHSELVLVSPEVSARARELLPERDPDAFLTTSPRVAAARRAPSEPGLATAVAGYIVLRLAETARSGLIVVGAIVALALLAQFSH
jgi:hypothetical protein